MPLGIDPEFGRALQEVVGERAAESRGFSQAARLLPVPVPVGGPIGYIEFSLTHTLLVGDEAASVLVSLSVNGPAVGTEMSVTNPIGMFSGDGHEPTGGSGSGYDVGRRGMAVDWGDGVFRIIQMECD
jgi:hypothetical protein